MILGLAPKADVTQRVLYDGLEDVGRLHADLLRKAAVRLALASRASLRRRLRLHVEFVDDDFEDVKVFDLKVAEELLIRLVSGIQFGRPDPLGGRWPAQLLINLVQEAIAAVLQLDDLLGLKLLDVVLVAGLLQRVVALIHHVRVIDTGRANHAHLVLLLLLL